MPDPIRRDTVMADPNRRDEHRRRPELERVLGELSDDLAPCAKRVHARGGEPSLPVVLIVGCPRSGTTLLYQWLAASGLLAYPSNLVARFFAAPWIGARIQRLLTDPACDHQGELTLDRPPDPAPFRSRLGKTRGLSAPNEFWYWWRRFLPGGETHALDPEQLATVDTAALRAELAAWEAVAGRPLLLKGMILDWNLPWLARELPTAVFLHVRRDPLWNMQSLLLARQDYFGSLERWYSFRPPEYRWLRDLPPAVQVAGQVHFTDRAVARGLDGVDRSRWLRIGYEELCRRPAELHARIVALLRDRGMAIADDTYRGPAGFPLRRERRLPEELFGELEQAWEGITTGAIPAPPPPAAVPSR